MLTPQAQSDIEQIWNYTANRWSLDLSNIGLRLVRTAIETVAADPDRGHICDDLRTGYRKYSTGSHVIFYRTTADGVDIVRVLHQRLDFDQHP